MGGLVATVTEHLEMTSANVSFDITTSTKATCVKVGHGRRAPSRAEGGVHIP